MPVPQHNPTKVLMETVRDQGYDPGDGLVTIEYSNVTAPRVQPLDAPDDYDHPPCPTEAQALTPRGPGDVHPVKFGPKSSDQGQ